MAENADGQQMLDVVVIEIAAFLQQMLDVVVIEIAADHQQVLDIVFIEKRGGGAFLENK